MKISSAQNERFILIFIFLATFLVRLSFLENLKKDPAVTMPIIDSLEFDVWAADILRGNILWAELQNHTPLYAYFLAAVYKVVGYQIPWVIFLQYIMASFSGVLLYRITRHLTNQLTAILAAALMATYWFFIYVQSLLYSENLSIFLNLLLVYNLLFSKERFRKYLFCGIIFGLSVICRPDILPFSVIILIWLRYVKISWKVATKSYILFLTGSALVLLPVLAQNYKIAKDFPLLRTQVGANIYMGNNPDFKGTNIYVGLGKDWEQFISMPHQAHKRDVAESESNRFFVSETMKIIKQRPMEWLGLMYKKAFSILTGRDFLRSEDVYFYNRHIAPTLFRLISTRLVFILAVTGLLITLASFKRFLIIYLYTFAGAFLIFFPIKTRYLIPLIPFVMIFSAWCVSSLYANLKGRNWPRAFLIIGLLFFTNTLSFFNPLNISIPTEAEAYYAIGKNYALRKMDDDAIVSYNRALDTDSQSVSVWNDLGLIWLNKGEYQKALGYFEKAIQLDPAAIKPKLNYQLCLKLLKI